jgi:hypothetical protein
MAHPTCDANRGRGRAEMLEVVSDDARHGAAGRDHPSSELPPVPLPSCYCIAFRLDRLGWTSTSLRPSSQVPRSE